MQQIHSIEDLRALLAEWREAGDTVALVPTMGNLHKGHTSLVELASEQAEHVVVSVFVNPTQFGPGEDFEKYPRTLETDARKLKRTGVDVLFAPSVEEMYPFGNTHATQVLVPDLSAELEGEHRPGHFAGVASIVCRLLNICQPDIAVFGQKDYQQLVILRRMVADLHMPVKLLVAPTARNENGLALSSRNSYLNEQQQNTAAVIYDALVMTAARLRAGERDYAALEQKAGAKIEAAGLQPEYVSIRVARTLQWPKKNSPRLVVLAAARLGNVRLIDNIIVDIAAANR